MQSLSLLQTQMLKQQHKCLLKFSSCLSTIKSSESISLSLAMRMCVSVCVCVLGGTRVQSCTIMEVMDIEQYLRQKGEEVWKNAKQRS